MPWHSVNRIPSMIVMIKDINLMLIDLERNAWWAHVIVAPDESKMIEFNSGISIGLKIDIPTGGQIIPSSMFGVMLLWK